MSSRLLAAIVCLLTLGASASARAQDPPREVTIPQENVSYDYAQVLAVEPIYQVLRATRSERVCDAKNSTGSGITRVVSAVKDRLIGGASREERAAGLTNCRMAPVLREYRRAIAFDVDYVYKGSRFRTRMGRDPGNRLRVRVSITPQPLP
jgi:uncharacterized protein YcfJ